MLGGRAWGIIVLYSLTLHRRIEPLSKLWLVKPDFGENVRGGREIFRGGVTMIYQSQQRAKIKNT